MVTVALPLAGIVPRFAVTVPLAVAQVPWLAAQERNEVPEGSGSVTTTVRASSGPTLQTPIV